MEHMKQKELFFQYHRFSACVDADYGDNLIGAPRESRLKGASRDSTRAFESRLARRAN